MHVPRAIEQNPEAALQTLEDDPSTSVAQITETVLGERRLGVRRVRTLDGGEAAAELGARPVPHQPPNDA